MKGRAVSGFRRLGMAWIIFVLCLCLQVQVFAGAEENLAHFSFRVLQKVMSQEEEDKNILISTDSILMALAMVKAGAAGDTLSQLKAALGGEEMDQFLSSLHRNLTYSESATYKTANSLWYKKGVSIKKSYKKKVKASYGAEVKEAAFDQSTVKKVNAWVKKNTEGMIPSILDHLDAKTRVMLINTVCFKANWREPYHKTYKRIFTKENGQKKRVKMVESQEDQVLFLGGGIGYCKYYKDCNIVFVGILPPQGCSLQQYLQGITGEDFLAAYQARRGDGRDLIIKTRMPLFSCDYEVSLKDILKKLGISSAFSKKANFSRMSKDELGLDAVYHKTHIKMTKEGTEAAAVTELPMYPMGGAIIEPEIWEVYLDRPFLYAIVEENTGFPLFLGVVRSMG